TISIGNKDKGFSLTSTIKRQHLPTNDEEKVLDQREYDICKAITILISDILEAEIDAKNSSLLEAIADAFDEQVIAQQIATHNGLEKNVIKSLLSQLHELSEQSYENKSLTFGCIIDSSNKSTSKEKFPNSFLKLKKYK
ncbi:MAG: hypothetical protein ACYDBH_23215, partial [Acidobacteriaceae bacterium]